MSNTNEFEKVSLDRLETSPVNKSLAGLRANKSRFWLSNQKLKDRILFGTDYNVMYITGIITMQNYLDNFKNKFKSDLRLLMFDNPERFLFETKPALQ